MATTKTAISILESTGQIKKQIPVELSYQIIHHFSEGLYSSPNKAIEELVANSYDAMATNVDVFLPENLNAEDATIWVVDNGEAMDIQGFQELWLIGESRKRDRERKSAKRLPIGKFGIGKLATYVLAKHLTYICKKKGGYYAVSMDFTKLEHAPKKKKFNLQARALKESDAKAILQPLLTGEKPPSTRLFGNKSAKTWTVAAMANLTDMGKRTSAGRLHRVLATALPINPQFNLFMDSERIEPEKLTQRRLQNWTIGKKDKAAGELDFRSATVEKTLPAVRIPQLGMIYGEVELFEDALAFGKSEDWGRSHGFFVMVRGRLINLHDELFGLEALSHGAFQRFRMVVHANGLDVYLRATRENVTEEAIGVKNFRNYLRQKFNEARTYYTNWLKQKERDDSLGRHVGRTPRSLSRQPLVKAIARLLNGEIDELKSIRIPTNLGRNAKAALLKDLEKHIDSEDFFKDVRFEALGLEEGVAIFDANDRCFKVNILHPFYSNYSEHFHSSEPYELFAVAEVLTETYLLEEGLSTDQVDTILRRRDRFLRELVYSNQLAAPLVAKLLGDSRASSKGFENAVYEGMRSLGLEVSKLGGKGKPDGIALARMGVRGNTGESATYKVAYDAKSTGGDKVSAKDLNIAGIVKHRKEFDADFSLIVAPGFDGDGDESSDACKHANEHDVTLIALDDFITLVQAAASRPLGFPRIRDEILKKCRGPKDVHEWLKNFLSEEVEDIPLRPILEVIWEMMEDSPDPPKFASIRERLAHKDKRFKGLSEVRIREWVESLARLEKALITIERDRVHLENPPDAIMRRIASQTRKFKRIDLAQSMYRNVS